MLQLAKKNEIFISELRNENQDPKEKIIIEKETTEGAEAVVKKKHRGSSRS